VPGQPGRIGKWQQSIKVKRQVKAQKQHPAGRQQPARTKKEWQNNQTRQCVFGQYIAVPDQGQMYETDGQQHHEPSQQQNRAPLGRKPIELNGKAHAEQ
jgi:hypothetical protein